MTKQLIILNDRSLIEISGPERHKFLQGLITNDINKIEEKKLIYSAMLNSSGRFLYDFFLFKEDEKIMLDCLESRCEEIIKKLTFYKLRTQVQIKKNDDFLVTQILEDDKKESLEIDSKTYFAGGFASDVFEFKALAFFDPRNHKLGKRAYILKPDICKINNKDFALTEESFYHLARIANKVAESEYDLIYEKSFILEFDFDNLNAIDYKKGCYVGQELTARTHYRGEIRKKLFHVTIEKSSEETEQFFIPKNSEIFYETNESKEVGIVLSSIFNTDKINALALLKLPENLGSFSDLELKKQLTHLQVLGKKISVIS